MEEANTNSQSTFKSTMNYGAVMGLALVTVSIIGYLLGTNAQTVGGIITYAIMAVGLFMSLKHYRDNDLGGYISYGKALGTGSLISLFAGIVLGFYTYVLYKFIDPGLVQDILEQQYQELSKQNMSEEQISQALQMTQKFMTPLSFGFFSVLTMFFLGFIFSLVISIFVKKENPEFPG